ncbi:MAG: hypothetical protein HN742_32135 [Lentisphaerae bacterium]|nr:hypothetical protein [Lentisphaerota bacterium]MBT7846563.1 hypothetical protein [Lentisphaerota bacterium]
MLTFHTEAETPNQSWLRAGRLTACAVITAWLGSGCAQCRAGSGVSDTPAPVSDARLLTTLCQPLDTKLAVHYFTPAVQAAFRREASVPRGPSGRPVRWPFFHGVYRAGVRAPSGYDLAADAWEAALPDGPPAAYAGPCPFCGDPFAGVDANMDPTHTGRTRCCKRTIYSHARGIPAADPVQPDASVTVPLRDGRTVVYPAYANAGGKLFVPASVLAAEIYRHVLNAIIPRLVNRVAVHEDADAARTLAAILDRLARVGTVLPYAKVNEPHVFARCRDVPALLPSGYDDLAASFAERPADAFVSAADHQRLVAALNAGPIRPNAPAKRKFAPAFLAAPGKWATAVEAWGIIARHPSVAALSRERHGDADAIGVAAGQLMREINAHVRFVPCPGGNFAIGWFPYHTALAVVCQDLPHAERVVERMESFLVNHHFAEGISHEGAFNYAAMMGACYEPWIARTFFGIDFTDRYPWLKRLHALGDYPVQTLAHIESTHADEHSAFFSSAKLWPPPVFDYASHERSQCFPEYGLTCLRAGAPGSRLELIMSHENPTMHTDPDRLGLQLFYEGVNLLPDIGYMAYGTDLAAAKAAIADSALRLGRVPEKGRYGYNDTVENHCTAAVNGNQFGLRCTTFERYFGDMPADDPRWFVQFVQVDGRPVFAQHAEPVDIYNRQAATINLPGGRPIVFDVFRIKGGRRHDLFWHVPAEAPDTDLDPPEIPPETNLHQFYSAHADPAPGWRKEEDPFSRFYASRNWRYKDDTLELLTKPTVRTPEPGQTWRAAWTIDPERYAPTFKSGRNEEWEKWGRLLQPVRLRIWGQFDGTPAKERILGAVGPWSSYCQGYGGLQFEEAFSYWIEHRQGEADLGSVFAHIIEPHTTAQDAAIETATILSDGTDDGRAARVHTRDGHTVYLASTLNGGVFAQDGLELNGRLGVLIPSAQTAFLYDGTQLRCPSMAVQLAKSWRLRLLGVRGDLTGDLAQSALFAESARPVPTNGVLTGMTITVRHQTNPAHTSGYRIQRVTCVSSPGDRPFVYRIDLAGVPGFIQYKYRVVGRDEKDPHTVTADKINLVAPNQPYLIGRRVRFPRTGFETAVSATGAHGWRAYHHRNWTLADAPTPEQVRTGDPMIVYAVQPGDVVEVPSFFVCRPRPKPGALHVATSGQAALTIDQATLELAPGLHQLHWPPKAE